MNCKKVKILIPIYLDKELEPQESQLVREHLAVCQGCQKELEAFERSWAMLGEAEGIQPEPGFVGQFWTRLALETTWYERFLWVVKESLVMRRLVPALVTASLIVIVGGFATNHYFQAQRTNKVLASLSEDDLIMIENMELAENLDIITEIDFFEELDLIESLNILET